MDITDLKQTGQILFQAALALQKAGEKKQALRLVKKALKKDPDNSQALVLAGLLHQDLGEDDKAEQLFRTELQNHPNNPDALKSLGLFLESHEREQEGLELMMSYLRQWTPKDQQTIEERIFTSTLMYDAAIYAWKYDKEQLATEAFKEAWERTFSVQIGLLYAQYLCTIEKHDEAIPLLEMLSRHSPRPDILFCLGTAFHESEDPQSAIQAYIQAIKLAEEKEYQEPFEDDWWAVNLSDIKDDWLDSADFNDDEIRYIVSPETISMYYKNLSRVYIDVDNYENALLAIENSFGYNENDQENWYIKIAILLALKRHSLAIEAAKSAVDLYANDDKVDLVDIYNLWAQALSESSLSDQALQILKVARGKYPKAPILYEETILILIKTGKQKEAFEIIDEAIQGGIKSPILAYDAFQLKFLTRKTQKDYQTILELLDPEIIQKEFIPIFLSHLSGIESAKLLLYGIQLFENLHQQWPLYAEITGILAMLKMGQTSWEQAESILSTLDFNNSTLESKMKYQSHLGYVLLLQGKREDARKILESASTQVELETAEMDRLGVAFYMDGKFVPDIQCENIENKIYIPNRSGDIRAIIKANLCSLALSQGDLDKATSLALDLLTIFPDDTLGYELFLFIARERNDRNTAQQAWKYIVNKAEDIEVISNNYKNLDENFWNWINEE